MNHSTADPCTTDRAQVGSPNLSQDPDEWTETLARLAQLEDELARLRTEVRCPRCSEPPPPLERWPGDARAREYRPACSCGRQIAWPA